MSPAVDHERSVPLVNHKGATVARACGPSPLRAIRSIGILHDTILGDRQSRIGLEQGLAAARNRLEGFGLTAVVDAPHLAVGPSHGRWHGTPRERGMHLIRLIESGADAIWPLFGKGGSSQVIDWLDGYGYTPSRPVDFIGAFSQQSDWGLYGEHRRGALFRRTVNATQLAYYDLLPPEQAANMHAFLSTGARIHIDGVEAIGDRRPDAVHGTLIGGNLGVLAANLTRTWMPALAGRIIHLEDYDKHPHEMHRQLDLVAQAAERAGAAALLVSSIIPIRPEAYARLEAAARRAALQHDLDEVQAGIDEIARRTAIPVFRHPGFAGHGPVNLPFFLNAPSTLQRSADGAYTLINESPTPS